MTDLSSNSKKARIAVWLCRMAFVIVFLINMQCALSFCFDPASYVGGFQLPFGGDGVSGDGVSDGVDNAVGNVSSLVAVQGLGVAFIMWNATYPAFIVSPKRFKVLGWVIIAQQAIGLVGESSILAGIQGAGYEILCSSLVRFIVFDGIGLVIMTAAFVFLLVTNRVTIGEALESSGCGEKKADG